MSAAPGDALAPRGRTKARSIVVGGDAESTVLSVARSLAESLDPAFAWLEIVDPRRQDPDPPLDGIPVDRLFHRVVAEQLRPRPPTTSRKLKSVVQEDESPETLRRLDGFLRLPELIQQISLQAGTVGPRRLLVIGRGERLVRYFPDGSPLVGELLGTLGSYGISTLVTYFGPVRHDRVRFDLVIFTSGTGPSATVSVEKGDPGTALASGARIAARNLASLVLAAR
ncbi:MAG TPA: hypothetical protein VGU43_01520 [Thermoplasmata archaeon]|nr:hypothetical protein [Thermoplasmata archaeon]